MSVENIFSYFSLHLAFALGRTSSPPRFTAVRVANDSKSGICAFENADSECSGLSFFFCRTDVKTMSRRRSHLTASYILMLNRLKGFLKDRPSCWNHCGLLRHSLIFCPFSLDSLSLFPSHAQTHRSPSLSASQLGVWCNWRGGGACILTANSPESETSNLGCQQMTFLQRRNADADKNDCVKRCNTNNPSDFSAATKGGDVQMFFYGDRVVTATVFLLEWLMILDVASAPEAPHNVPERHQSCIWIKSHKWTHFMCTLCHAVATENQTVALQSWLPSFSTLTYKLTIMWPQVCINGGSNPAN